MTRNNANLSPARINRLSRCLMAAFKCRNEEKCLQLLAKGPDVNYVDEEGVSLLYRAIVHHKSKVALALIAAGADVNHQDFTKRAGRTALMHACFNGDEAVVDALLAKGADVNLRDKAGLTALVFASEFDGKFPKGQLVKRLLKETPDLEVRTRSGDTLLTENCMRPKNVRRLIAAGANLTGRNKDGTTAYDRVRGNAACAGTAAVYESFYDQWSRAILRGIIDDTTKAIHGAPQDIKAMKPLRLRV